MTTGDASLVVVPGEHDFWMRFEHIQTPRSTFEAQGDSHGDIDLRLVERIENLLVPQLGPWENSDRWFHQMDFYGDGVRSLTFSHTTFPRGQIRELQALLVGEHTPFAILCTVTDAWNNAPEAPPTDDGYLAIFADQLLVTRPLAASLMLR